MLCELQIENVAVIEKAVVSFEKRFNVLTGETGAGKSILIDSINAILGNRTNKEIVRSGADKASIVATFDNIPSSLKAAMADQGYDSSDVLILSREVFAEGRSLCRINGKPATASIVRELCQNLVNIHGQLDNQELLDPDKHINILDRYSDLERDVQEYQITFEELLDLQKRISSLQMNENEKSNRIDLLTYQLNEIEQADLKPEEETELQNRRIVLKNSERITSSLHNAVSLMDESDSPDGTSSLDHVLSASNELEHIRALSDKIDSVASRINDSYFELGDIISTIQQILSSFEYDPNEMETLEDRLDLIYKLKKKYGETIPDIMTYAENARKELNQIVMSDELLDQLKTEFKEKKAQAIKLAQSLSKKRLDAFLKFSKEIKNELSYLNMPTVELEIDHRRTKELTPSGMDQIEFLISTNPGETPKALSKIASGGEMARIMLAIKNVLAEKDGVATLIFDEIDTGVSGKSAQKIGEKLKQISLSHQVICVTHSAQVAAYANNHLKIEKSVIGGRTYTTVKSLDHKQRVEELARIISGENLTSISLKNAEEMLSIAQDHLKE